jgi:Protein of Unknown function (DUF2784)
VIYGLLAELLLFVHLTFMKFVAVGGLLVLRWRWVVWVHLPAAILGAVLALGGWYWPFRGLEQLLRQRGAVAGYRQNLVEQFLPSWLHPATMPRPLEMAIGLLVLAMNVYIYRRVLRELQAVRRRRNEGAPSGTAPRPSGIA